MNMGDEIVKKNKYEIDMCNGSIMDKLISFSLPLMLSGILQLMFNALDIVVVGRFGGSRLHYRTDQCVYQPFYRDFSWCQCAGSQILCCR